MRPVEQTRTGPTRGNCFQAALASVLELPVDGLPEQPADGADAIATFGGYLDTLRAWLQARGRDLFGVELKPALSLDELGPFAPAGYYVAGVTVPGWEYLHAVVCRGTAVVHDPYPVDTPPTYITEPRLECLWVVVELDPWLRPST